MTAPLDAALTRYAARLLVGTGLDPAAAEALATNPALPPSPEAAAAAAALRDGWADAAHAQATPSPAPAAGQDQP